MQPLDFSDGAAPRAPVPTRAGADGPALASLGLLVLAAWAALLAQAWRAGGDEPFLAALCQPAAGIPAAGVAGFLADWGRGAALWAVMSTAMMLPTAVPLLVSYREAARRSARKAASVIWLVLGYAAVWLAVSVAASLVQASTARLTSGWSLPPGLAGVLAGAVVGGAGLYQFSTLKLRCLTFCRREVRSEDLAASAGATWVHGTRQGVGCLGCCGAMMALMLLAGFANLFWMAGFAVLMALEKLADGVWATRLIGVLLLGLGFAVAVAPLGLMPVLGALGRLIAGGTQ